MTKLEQLKENEQRLLKIAAESQALLLEAAIQFASDRRLYGLAVRNRKNYEGVLKEQGNV